MNIETQPNNYLSTIEYLYVRKLQNLYFIKT